MTQAADHSLLLSDRMHRIADTIACFAAGIGRMVGFFFFTAVSIFRKIVKKHRNFSGFFFSENLLWNLELLTDIGYRTPDKPYTANDAFVISLTLFSFKEF